MSLHATLSPEAKERLEAQQRNSVITSIVISILIVTLVILILLFILLPALRVDSHTIVTYSAGLEQEEQLEKKEINPQIQRKPSAPSSAMAKVITSTTPSPTAVPVPDIEMPEPSTDFGSGDDFGDGWGTGGDGGGGGFGNIPAVMRKRCSPEDRLQRLKASGGNEKCEDAVVGALRWMQKTQAKDGSWGPHKVAYTGLALLAYLGHCETPLSEEFGETVMNAMVFLINNNQKQKGRMGDDLKNKHWVYEHAIAAYALAESYTFCSQLGINLPKLKESVEAGTQWIIDNQSNTGGWDYGYNENSNRSDMSITAWQMQALKAAKHTGLEFRNMRRCIAKALSFCNSCQASNGGFGYANKSPVGGANGHYTLTGAGALCFQQHKSFANSSARKGVRYIEKEGKFNYRGGPCNLYEHYYNSQAMINDGGKAWERYNALFRDQLLNAQNKDGSWPKPGGGGPGMKNDAIYITSLSTLMLEVYYRFLPGTGSKN